METEKVVVMGTGAWGTAVALQLHRNRVPTVVWGRNPDYVKLLREKRENTKYLPGIPLPRDLVMTADADEALDGAGLVMVSVPTQFIRGTLGGLLPAFSRVRPDAVFVSLAKGIEKGTHLRVTEVLQQVLSVPSSRTAVLSGPSHAEELARNLPTTVVVAAEAESTARRIQELSSNESFRVYTSTDVAGVELGGALKNVIALAAGMCDGLHFGDNSKAALLTRGLSEISRLGCAMGAKAKTFSGLSGVGDLMTTCFSPFGRNREVGERIGRGEKLAQVLATMEKVAEGVSTVQAVCEFAGAKGVEMPIAIEVHRILFEDKDPRVAVRDLMLRDTKPELT